MNDQLKQQAVGLFQNGLKMNDTDFESGLSSLGQASVKAGMSQDYWDKFSSGVKDARSNALLNPQVGLGTQIGRDIASPFTTIAATTGAGVLDAAGWVSDKAGDVLQKAGLNGIAQNLHSFGQTAEQGVENVEQYGIPMGPLGRVQPLGSREAMAVRQGQMGEGEAIAKAALDAAGTGAQLVSYGVGGEGGPLGASAAKMAGLFSGGQMAKDAAAGDDTQKVITDGMTSFLGGMAGGAILHGVGAGLGSVGASIAKTSLGQGILNAVSGVVKDVGDMASQKIGDGSLMQTVYSAAANKLSTMKMGLMGLYNDAIKKPEVDMLDAMTSDTSKSRSLIEAKKNEAFGNVFNNDTELDPSTEFSKTNSLIEEKDPGRLTNDEYMSIPPEQQVAQGKFQNWLNTLKGYMLGDTINTKTLDPYIMASRPSFGGTGEYDKYASQILGSMRDEFGSYLKDEQPELYDQFKNGMQVKNQIDSFYKTNLMEEPKSAPSQDEMNRRIVTRELKSTDPEIQTFVDGLSPTVKQNFKNGLVNSVRKQAWDAMVSGGFSPDSYKAASSGVDDFVKNYAGTAALDPTDAFKLKEWSSFMGHDFTKEPTFQGALEGATGAQPQAEPLSSGADISGKMGEMSSTAQSVKALKPMVQSITDGNLSEVPSQFTKLSPEEQKTVFSSLSDDGKMELGQSILSDRVGDQIEQLDPKAKVQDMSGVYKAVKSIYDDKNVFENGFSPEQQAAIEKFVTYVGAAKNVKELKINKTVSKIIGGAFLGSIGHPMWGMGVAGHGAMQLISDFMSSGKAADPEIQTMLDKAEEMLGSKSPTSSRLLSWTGELLKNNLVKAVGVSTGAKAAQTLENAPHGGLVKPI